MAARIRELALGDAREQVNALCKELAMAYAELRSSKAQIMQLEIQIENYRGQLARVINRAGARHRTMVVMKCAKMKVPRAPQNKHRKAVASKAAEHRRKR